MWKRGSRRTSAYLRSAVPFGTAFKPLLRGFWDVDIFARIGVEVRAQRGGEVAMCFKVVAREQSRRIVNKIIDTWVGSCRSMCI